MATGATGGILERLKRGAVIGDGGYLVELERRGLVGGELYVPTVALDRPDALAELHREFLDAGAEVLQSLTFWTTSDKLANLGWRSDKVAELNRAAVRVARQAAGDRALIAAGVTHTFHYWHRDAAKPSRVRDILREQVEVLASCRPDFLILETFFCIGEMRIALEEARKTGLPIMATMSFRPHLDRTEDEIPAEELGRILAGEGADVVGINCEQGPEAMLPILRRIAAGAPRGLALAAQPTAFRTTSDYPYYSGLPEFHGEPGLETVQVSRGAFAKFAREALTLGVRYFGGCCGCNAAYLRVLAAEVRRVDRCRSGPSRVAPE